MNERRTRNARSWIAASVFVALIAGAILLVRPSAAPKPAKPTEEPAAKVAPIPLPPPPLDRAALIEAAALAADAAATGAPAPDSNAALAGRRFILILPFGCAGPSGKGALSWTYDEGRETLRARVTPQVWSQDEGVKAIASGLDYEAAEGFWISRPWIRSDTCPVDAPLDASASQNEAPVAPEQVSPQQQSEARIPPETLALIEFFAQGSRRAARRNGRAYTLSERLAPGEVDLGKGLRLVVEGRLVAFPGGQPIACRIVDRQSRPLCLINAEIGRVSITDASGQRLLAEWTD